IGSDLNLNFPNITIASSTLLPGATATASAASFPATVVACPSLLLLEMTKALHGLYCNPSHREEHHSQGRAGLRATMEAHEEWTTAEAQAEARRWRKQGDGKRKEARRKHSQMYRWKQRRKLGDDFSWVTRKRKEARLWRIHTLKLDDGEDKGSTWRRQNKKYCSCNETERCLKTQRSRSQWRRRLM
ncbi:hypothetical protein PIB30_083560, partial [Stylosanthes scabra]|nr:hypothetical protein [Stylosanthes scabra]